MALAAGTRLGPYEIVAPLGAGGMGVVYRARDTRLNRDVAIKVLPEDLADDPDRLARFEREARALASLNHPNIAQIFGLEGRAIAMELVEGVDLSQRIARGAIPIEEALSIARQIADALEAAHERGIIHRDLKPANVKVRDDGTVKVLDFGLAKAMAGPEDLASGGDLANSPTLTSPATKLGMILGTAAYMSPEQARGKAVDRRADVWAFGVVLYEMLTGRRAFAGDDVAETLGAVLGRELDFAALPSSTPRSVARLIRRCLVRDPKNRLRDIGDARWDLDEAAEPGQVVPAVIGQRLRTWLPWVATIVAAAVAAWALWSPVQSEPGAVEGHFTIALPADAPLVTFEMPGDSEGPVAVSPDGREVVYVAPNGSGTRLYARAMADLTPRALAGTEGARAPFFSPNGQWVGFFADGKLKKTLVTGGTPVPLAEAPDGQGGTWGPEGEILFAPNRSTVLFAVSDAGGTPRAVTTLDFGAGDDAHRWPQVMPGRRAALFTVSSWSRETSDIVLVDLATGTRSMVQQGVYFARYVPAAPGAAVGHLVFVRGGALMAAPFDPARTEPAGPPIAVVEGVRAGQFDVSASGVLAYTPGSGAAMYRETPVLVGQAR